MGLMYLIIELVWLLFLLFLLIVLLIWCVKSLIRDVKMMVGWIKATRLIKKGELDQAIISLRELVGMYKKRWRTVRNPLIYSIAVCCHRKGDFEESIRWLEQMKKGKMDRNATRIYFGVYAANLLMLGRDLARAGQYLEKAELARIIPTDLLYRSYLELLKGNMEQADRWVGDFHSSTKTRRFMWAFFSFCTIDQRYADLLNNFLLGFYYVKKGEHEEAKRYLSAARRYPYQDYYSKRAAELLRNTA